MSKTTVVLGASPKPDRYSNKAMLLLREHGHKIIPVHPKYDQIEGIPVVHRLSEISEHVDTLTLYVGPAESSKQATEIIALHPQRVIMNPGAENDELARQLETAGIAVEKACTLVLLKTKQF